MVVGDMKEPQRENIGGTDSLRCDGGLMTLFAQYVL
jgi:hypothetical protein